MTAKAHSANQCVLGADFGTGGCKVCVVARDGLIAGTGAAAYATLTPASGWTEQNPLDWMKAFAGAVSELRNNSSVRPEQIAAVALSSAAHVAVLLDDGNCPVRNAILWNDQRSGEEVAKLEADAGEEILARTFNRVSTTWTLPHLAWIRRNDPEAWRRTRRILLSKDFIAYQLTGVMATDPATAVSSMLYDAVNHCWSGSLCELAGITPGYLGKVLPATGIIGCLTGAAARRLNLIPGTPVVNGTLDSAAETYGAGVISPGLALLRLASAGGIHVVLDKPRPHPRLITYPHPVEPLWFSQAGTNTCATAVKWATGVFAPGKKISFEEWDREAAEIPIGSGGLMFHPYLAGERCPYWDSRLRASFVGATLQMTSAYFARAVYEGTACSIRDALGVIKEAAPEINELTVVGGGAASELWLRIASDCLNLPLNVKRHADSSYGAALLGMAGLGFFKSPEDALAVAAGTGKRIEPERENARLYAKIFERYRELHSRLSPFYHGGEDKL